MIKPEDLKRIAREKEVDPTTIERDHVQNWFLKSLYANSDYLIFKGGTSIRKVFIKDYRFSDDLDFTLARDISQEDMGTLIDKAKEYVHDEIGTSFEPDTAFKDTDSGWKVKLRYISRITGHPTNLILDLTHSDLEIVVTDTELHKLIQEYDEDCEFKMRTYSFIEITAEKSRALCQRGYPRDLYDVCNLWPMVENDAVKEVFDKKCAFKGFEPTLEAYDGFEEKLKGAWEKSLRHQLKELPNFTETYQRSRDILKDFLRVQ